MASRATSSFRSAASIAWCMWPTGGIGRIARSRTAAIADIQRRMRRAHSAQVGERVGVDTGRREGREGRLQLVDRARDAAGAWRLERHGEVPTRLLDDRRQRGLGPQGLDLEGLHRVEHRRCSAHGFNGCLERDIRLIARSRLAPPLRHAQAVLRESEQLLGLRKVGLDLDERLPRIADDEAFDGLADVRDASFQTLDLGAQTGDDLGSTPRPRDPLGERRDLLIEHVLGRFAQLHDALISSTHLVGGAGDRIVIEPVQTERVAQVSAHVGERFAQPLGRAGSELRLGEAELVGGEADALVGREQGRSGPLRQVGVVDLEFVRTASAPDPEPGHAPILGSPLGARYGAAT